MHYMHLPTFEQQTKGLMEYLYKANAVMVRAFVVYGYGWDERGEPSSPATRPHSPPLAPTH